MVEIELKSKELTEYVYLTLNKDRSTPIYDNDLDRITDITLDALDFLGEPTDTTIFDLIFFNGLKSCILANMNISEKEVDVLNKLNSIESIQFKNCIFPRGKKINMQASYVIVDGCIEFDASIFSDMKSITKLRVVNCEHVKLDGIESLSEMTELYLQNLEIDNIDNVSGLDKLEYINLNGTKVKKLTDILKNTKIKVDHEEKNYIFDVEE